MKQFLRIPYLPGGWRYIDNPCEIRRLEIPESFFEDEFCSAAMIDRHLIEGNISDCFG
jgi:hypothetical protein